MSHAECQARWKARHPEQVAEIFRQAQARYRKRHPDREREAAARYKKRHPDRVRATYRRYLTPTRISFRNMHGRCRDKNNRSYGGRGIKVCNRWGKFKNFLADMGERPKRKTLDRKRVNGNYTPQNCRWATRDEQATNRRAR